MARSRFLARFAGLVVALAAVSVARALSGEALVALPGPAPRQRSSAFDAKGENDGCVGCHVDEAREWSGSLHQRAWRDPVFLAQYAAEPIAFCRGCHAPEADAAKEPDASAREVGVGCVTCHVEADRVVGARVSRSPSPHPVFVDARLATEEACARCHDFGFPALPKHIAMQGTVREHAESPHADEACASCHMPRATRAGRSHRSHDFSVIGRAEMLERAVGVEATRAGSNALMLRLRTTGAGHAVPTGDLFRRLELRAFVEVDGRTVAATPVVLGRRFTEIPTPGSASATPMRVPIGDDRVPASGAPREVLMPFPISIDAKAVRWEVVYARMGDEMARRFGLDPALDRVVIAKGTLAPIAKKGPR